MALSNKARRRWSLVILLVGLPIYILVASVVITWLAPKNILVELLVYVALGIAWIFPFKSIFTGIGQLDDDPQPSKEREEH